MTSPPALAPEWAQPDRSTSPGRRRSRLARRAAALGLAAAVATLAGPVGAAGGDPVPTMSISPAIVDAGQSVVVSTAGWPAGTITAVVCGDSARHVDDDCDLAGGRTVPVDATGSATTSLSADPPVPCPCAVRVSTGAAAVVQTLPLQLRGSSSTPESTDPATRQMTVSARVLAPELTWSSAFGLGKHATLELTVRNTGSAPVDGLAIEAAVGRPGASGRSLSSPLVGGPLRPGEQRVIEVPFEVPTPAAGEYVASGRVTGLDQPVGFHATTDSQPWGLAVVVLAAALAALGWWIGSRRGARGKARDGSPPPVHDDQMARG